jgi:N-acylglucosamine 2-epimerase
MNRRGFIAASLGTAASGLPRAGSARSAPQGSPAQAVVTRLAGLSLQDLRDQFRRDLFDDFLPFMDKYIIDHEYGGFMCNTDRDGTHLSEEKTTWFEGRGIWVYSFLYRNFGRDKKYLDVARKSLEFILKAEPAGEDTLWPGSFTREGKPLTPPATTIYGDMFVAEGLAEYAQATGEWKYWEHAKRILFKCLRFYDRPDYAPDIAASYAGPPAIIFPGARIQGVAMVVTRLVTQMLEMRPDPELEKAVARSVQVVLQKHYNPAFQLNNELLNHDYSRPTNELAEFVYTGHSIETLWMILHEAARREDRELFRTVAERFHRHLEVAWDDVYGGVFRSLNNVDRNLWALDKVLWAQQEVLNGTLFITEQTGAAWAEDWFGKMYACVRAKYWLKPHGYALWITNADRKVTFEPHATRVEHYHLPRYLMLSLLVLERMIRRDGKVPSLFAGCA